MNYKKTLIVAFILLAVLSVGAVSASEDADVIAQDTDLIVSQNYDEINDADASSVLESQCVAEELAVPLQDDASQDLSAVSDNVTAADEDENANYQDSQMTLSDVDDDRLQTVITSEDIRTHYNSEEFFHVKLSDVNGYYIADARIDVEIGEFEETVYTGEGGVANVSVRGLKPGNYRALVKFEGDEYCAPSSTTSNVVIAKTGSKISALNTITPYDSDEEMLVYLEDAYGHEIYDAAIVAVFDDFEETTYTDEHGFANVSLRGLKPGSYTPQIKFEGNECFNPSSTTANVVITKANSNIIASDVITQYNSGEYLLVYLQDDYDHPVYNSTIIAVFYDSIQNVKTDEIGQANVSLKGLEPGNYVPDIMFVGNDCYNPSSTSAEVVITKANTHISTSYVGGVLSAYLTDDYGNPVSGAKVGFANNGVTYIYTDDNGEAKYSTEDLPEGTYTVRIKYYGDNNYNPSNQAIATITVSKTGTILNASDVTVNYHEDAYLVASLKDANGTPVSGAKIGFANNGVTYIYTDENGEARYSTMNLEEGTYNVKIKFYGNDEYGPSNQAMAKITVLRMATNLTASDMHALYHEDAYLVASLKDANGTPVSGAKIGFANNGVTYIYTDENGEARYSTMNLEEGTYTVKMKFYGDDNYSPSNQAVAKVVIGKIATELSSADVHVVYGDDGYLIATLTDANGNPVSGAKVGFANNGVTYVATDENGQAKYSTKDLAKGTYTVKMKFYGSDAFEPSNQASAKIYVGDKIATVLSSADVHVKYGADDYLIATLRDTDGNPVSGVKVGFANNGVTYVYTDENGEARYSTKNLAEGTYTVTMKFYGNDVYEPSNQVRARVFVGQYVTPTLSSDGVTTTYGADDYLVATLTGINYAPIVGAKILFTVFGQKIVDTTDSSGHAKIPTKGYTPGIYNVALKFAGNSMYSEATATTKMTITRA